MKGLVLEKIRQIAERVTESEGLELVDVQLLGGGRQRVLRLFIDKPAGVTLEDCENISHQVGTILDVEDVVPGEGYTLEVSSPGVDRPLMKPKDYERFIGQKIKLQLRQPRENRKRFDGRLEAFDGSTITLSIEKGELIQIPLSEVEKANLKYEWQ
jgi:ribosome maturation factor RimP